jgi:hypothetical protein
MCSKKIPSSHDNIESSVVDPDPHWFWSDESGSRRAKITQKKFKKVTKFKFGRVGCLSFEGFSNRLTSFMEA